MNLNYCIGAVIAVASIIVLAGCASRGRALRPTIGFRNDPPADVSKADSWYIESTPQNGGKPFSCSFVEFDERGDYLDFQQHVQLTSEWPLDDSNELKKASANPLPFDLIMLVNSAAPSIYAKQFYEYMAAHRAALAMNHVPNADAPIVISLTSTADKATGIAHPTANIFAPFNPSLWRCYDGRDFILETNASPMRIPQWYYYRRTPGHNPLLVNHWIIPSTKPIQSASDESLFHQNMDLNRVQDIEAGVFQTTGAKGKINTWEITTVPPDPAWSTYRGAKPYFLGSREATSGYWIMQCSGDIISNHGDIWNERAMATYAALFRLEEHLRNKSATHVSDKK